MKTTTLIKRAAAKLEKQMQGCTEAQIQKALRINFPSLYA